ncbi:glycoside hydrolase superfamily [Geopyxis carbonaria]|nr:glycoside hydrolase superfamily [Geopyxis carbonaria]
MTMLSHALLTLLAPLALLALLALSGTATAQSTAYGQCGGLNWTGATSCVSGYACVYLNDWYSQCQPSSSTAPTVTTTSVATTPPAPTSTGGPRTDTGRLPALGWNSWNAYRGDISAAKIVSAANALVSLGLAPLGYVYVNIDDCWSALARSSGGALVPDAAKFPGGISGVADTVHALGLKLGIYGDAGEKTCSGYPGSLGYETVDAQTWAAWGVDYLKYDNCNVPSSWADAGSYSDWGQSRSAQRYKQMTAALNAVSRPIQYALCNWGNAQVWTWGASAGHSWRMTGDSSATWTYIQSAIAMNANYLRYVGFYAHNDMDMMEIGNGALTAAETRTHFAMWVALKSPILLGTDLTLLTSAELAVIKTPELLAFHQDATIGAPATPYVSGAPPEYYAGTSAKGTHVFAINLGAAAATRTVTFADVPGLSAGTAYVVHDMWTGTDLGTFTGSWGRSVESHDTLAVRITEA